MDTETDEGVAAPQEPEDIGRRLRIALTAAILLGWLAVTAALGGVGGTASGADQVGSFLRAAVSAPTHSAVHPGMTPAGSQLCHGRDCLRNSPVGDQPPSAP